MDQVKIGRFIASVRVEEGMTQVELGNILGVNNRTVSKWECGNGLPEVTHWQLLCETLHISADELLRGERMPRGGEAHELATTDNVPQDTAHVICEDCKHVFDINKVRNAYNLEYKGSYDYDKDVGGKYCFPCACLRTEGRTDI